MRSVETDRFEPNPPRASLFAITLAIENKTLRGGSRRRVDPRTNRVRAARLSARCGRVGERSWSQTPLAQIPVGDDFPCRACAVGRATQHQGFLNTDEGSLAVGPAVVETGRTAGCFLPGSQWLGRDQSRATGQGKRPNTMADHCGLPESKIASGPGDSAAGRFVRRGDLNCRKDCPRGSSSSPRKSSSNGSYTSRRPHPCA